MKILVQGQIKEEKPIWPIGRTFSCHKCNCQFIIEKGDKFYSTAERCPNGKRTMEIECPNKECHETLKFIKYYSDPDDS